MEIFYCFTLLIALAYTCVIITNIDKLIVKAKMSKSHGKVKVNA